MAVKDGKVKIFKMRGFRVPDQTHANYYNRILEDYANTIYHAKERVVSVEFGKQDMRGLPSITWNDSRHFTIKQIHFNNNKELMQYCVGFVEAYSFEHDDY